jgi:aspartyl-tRNA(Asn)/glutamyl-tRNA(Gln) amidotransferase subunit B
MRSKEEAHDYRYFPEPDLTPITITDEMLERARLALPELPGAREERYRDELGLHPDAARLLAWRSELGAFYEEALAADGADPRTLANWVTNELVQRLGADVDPAVSEVTPQALAGLVVMVADGKVTAGAAKTVLDRLVERGGEPAAIVEAEGLAAMGGGDELADAVKAALDANPDIADRLRGGDMKPMGVVIGHVMKATKGRADGKQVTKLVRELLAG